MAFGVQENISQHLPKITPSTITKGFKQLKVHNPIDKPPELYTYCGLVPRKEIINAGSTINSYSFVSALIF